MGNPDAIVPVGDPAGSRSFDPARDLDAVGLPEYWQMIWVRKLLVLALIVAGATLGFLSTIPQIFLYPATATIEIREMNANYMGLSQVDPQAGNYTFTDVNIGTQIEVLQSNALRARVYGRLQRELTPSMPPPFTDHLATLRRIVQDKLGRTPSDPLQVLERGLYTAAQNMRINPIEKTRIIQISTSSTSPEIAAAFVNTIASEYAEQMLEARLKSAQRTSQWLTNQIQALKTKLEDSEDALQQAIQKSDTTVPLPDQAATLAQTKLGTLQAELSAIQTERIQKETAYRTALASPDTIPMSTLSVGHKQQLDTLKAEVAQLTTYLTPEHYKVQRLQAQVRETESALARERAQDRALALERLKADIEAARSRERSLSAAYSAQAGSIAARTDKFLEYSLIKREVDTNRQLYNAMVQQLNQAGIAFAAPTESVRIVDEASPATKPSNLNQTINTMLGGTTGLLFGCLFSIVAHRADRSLRAPGSTLQWVSAPEIAVIPTVASENGRFTRLLPQALARRFTGPVQESRLLVGTTQERTGILAESFRGLLAAIDAGALQHTVLLVTSPNPREGKSTVAANLAVSLAEARKSVVLIDGDLRRPSLHRIFRVPNEVGLTNVTSSTDGLVGLVQDTDVPTLKLLPAGPPQENVASVLYSDRLSGVLNDFRKSFDVVIIDAPPVLAVADARVLARHADGVLLVVRSGITARESSAMAAMQLRDAGLKIAGTILNDWTPARNQHDAYYGYCAADSGKQQA